MEVNGKFIEQESWHSEKVLIEFEKWVITFDHYTAYTTVLSHAASKKYIRVTVPVFSQDGFRFEIYRQDLLSYIGKIVGAQDVKIGDGKFDKNFVIKTNDVTQLNLFLNTGITDLISKQTNINVHISDQQGIWEAKLPPQEPELSFYAEGKIDNVETLKSILLLFQEMLKQLKRLKSIA